jgi:hypothetical protein
LPSSTSFVTDYRPRAESGITNSSVTTTTDLVLNNIYTRRKSITPIPAESIAEEEERRKEKPINSSVENADTNKKRSTQKSSEATKTHKLAPGYKVKRAKSFFESLSKPIDESPETKWDLKFPPEVEILYTVYTYHLISRMNFLPMTLFCLLWIGFVVLEFLL